MSGTIPSSVGNLLELTTFNMSTNQLFGTIPDSLGNLQFLQDIYLNHNLLSGTLPSSLGNLGSLQNLVLNTIALPQISCSLSTVNSSHSNLLTLGIHEVFYFDCDLTLPEITFNNLIFNLSLPLVNTNFLAIHPESLTFSYKAIGSNIFIANFKISSYFSKKRFFKAFFNK